MSNSDSKAVHVGGIDVTQELLERMFSALRERHWFGIPADYRPSIEIFALGHRGGGTYERAVYDYIDHGTMPDWFNELFLGAPKPTPTHHRHPSAIISDAGFPAIITSVFKPWERQTDQTIGDWAVDIAGKRPSWLWVRGGDLYGILCALAQAAVAADNASAGIEIVYKDVRDLCAEYNSADLYGENSKSNLLRPLCRHTVLMLGCLGLDSHSTHELEALSQLIESRHDQMLPTVVGSTMGISEWAGCYRHTDHDRARKAAVLAVHAMSGYAPSDKVKAEAARRFLDLGA